MKTTSAIHPLSLFRFCPVCGHDSFLIHNGLAKKCASCGFVYYSNPRGATVALIFNAAGELLVARRAKEPSKGMLDLPGGFIDLSETAEEAVAREVSEETGLRAAEVVYLFSEPNQYYYSGMTIPTIDLFFRCVVNDFSALKAEDDVAELLWVRPSEIDLSAFAFASIRQGLMRFFDGECQNKTSL